MSGQNLPHAESLYQELLTKLTLQHAKLPFQLAGLASGGAWIAQRLAKDLNLTEYGIINVSFHRDDYVDKGVAAFRSSSGMATKLPFDVNGAYIIVVDDILDTGRTVRAALNEIFDYGRPARIDLAVLVDRQRRELPVYAAFKCYDVELPANQILILEQNHGGLFEFIMENKESGKKNP